MLGDRVAKHGAGGIERSDRARFVGRHQPGVAGRVGRKNGEEVMAHGSAAMMPRASRVV